MTPDLHPGDLVDGYRIVRPLGRGGMGVVFEAEHVRLGRRVAFKVLQAERSHDPAFHERFEREARLAARLDHPNVVAVHDAGVSGGRPWIAMALVEGEDLRSRLRRTPDRPDPRLAVDVVRQVGAALDHAHAKGVLHRDVKPANVFLAEHDGRLTARLGDFGLTKEVDAGEELTASGMVVGSIDYLAPEVLEQRDVGVRSDVYALAATLLTALTGAPPFSGTATARMVMHGSAPRPRPSERRPELGPFDAVVLRGLAVDPEHRYASAGALAEAARGALEIVLGGRVSGAAGPPGAAPPPTDDDFEIVLRGSQARRAPGRPSIAPTGPSAPGSGTPDPTARTGSPPPTGGAAWSAPAPTSALGAIPPGPGAPTRPPSAHGSPPVPRSTTGSEAATRAAGPSAAPPAGAPLRSAPAGAPPGSAAATLSRLGPGRATGAWQTGEAPAGGSARPPRNGGPSERILAARRAEAAEDARGGRRTPRGWLAGVAVVTLLAGGAGGAGGYLLLRGDDPAPAFAGGAAPVGYTAPGGRWTAVLPATGSGWSAPVVERTDTPGQQRVVQRGPGGRTILVDFRRDRSAGRPDGPSDAFAHERYDGGRIARIRSGGPQALRCGGGERASKCVGVRLDTAAAGPGWAVVVAAPTLADARPLAERIAGSLRLR